jgi:hypothetical protein
MLAQKGGATATTMILVHAFPNAQADEQTFSLHLGVGHTRLRTPQAAIGPDHRFYFHHFDVVYVNGQTLGQIGHRQINQYL